MSGKCTEIICGRSSDVQIDDGLRSMGARPEHVHELAAIEATRLPVPVMLAGYDVVGIHTRAHWATGNEYDWRGQR